MQENLTIEHLPDTANIQTSSAGMSAKDAARFCHGGKRLRQAVLLATGFCDTRGLTRELNRLTSLQNDYDALMVANPDWKTKCRFTDYVEIQDLHVKSLNASRAEEWLLSQHRQRGSYLLLTSELRRHDRGDVIDHLEQKMDKSFTG